MALPITCLMPGLTENNITRLSFLMYENPGVYALLIGSGLSRAAGIPTGWEITLDLIRRVALLQGEGEQPDWVAWYREKTSEEPDYSKLVSELGLSRDERRSILDGYIEPSAEDRQEGRKTPTQAHYAIADLVQAESVRVIITTNFDRLLENALREKGVEPVVVASADALKGAEPLAHADCFLFKLHGDYKDARILNTDAELSSYPKKYDELLNRIFDEYGLLVCGWSGEWDHALRKAIMRSPARRYSMFWTAIDDPGEVAKGLIEHRKGHLITIEDADSFFVKIHDYVETLGRTHKRNPRSVNLLVRSAKKYIAEPEYRIRLDDLLTAETKLLFEKLESADLSVEEPFSAEEFQRQVNIYESTVEPLARIAGVLGRWGKSEERKTITDIVTSMLHYADRERSRSSFLILRSYPAVLLVAGYGIGAVRAQRWDALHSFLTESVKNYYDAKPKRIVEKLFLSCWEGGEDDLWRSLEGLDGRRAAFSDHLYSLFARWSDSFVGVAPNFEELYETWEILGSLAYCERYTLEDIRTAMSGNRFVWVPVGLSGLKDRNPILQLIQGEDLKKSLLQAGFAKGQEEFLDEALANFQRIAKHTLFRWHRI